MLAKCQLYEALDQREASAYQESSKVAELQKLLSLKGEELSLVNGQMAALRE